jgi:hypothetical protein
VTLETQIVGSPATVAATRALLWVFLVASVIIGVLRIVVGAVSQVGVFQTGEFPLQILAGQSLPATANAVGTYETASVLMTDASADTFTMAAISSISLTVTETTIALLIAVLAWRLLHRGMFRRSLSIFVALAGGVMLIGGMISQGASGLASGMAARDLNGGDLDGFWPVAGRFDPSFLGPAFALLLIGLAFEVGERLQRETAGLV